MRKYKLICKTLTENGLALEELNNYENFKEHFSESEFQNILREKQNRKNKRYRTKSKLLDIMRLKNMLSADTTLVFLTIDPNNELLSQSEQSRIRKIERWLKEHFLYTILNKDFGDKTEREHYHGIAITTEKVEQLFHEDGTPKKSKKGLLLYELANKNFEDIAKTKEQQFEPTLCVIDFNKNDIDKTINYLLKLNNHSNKATTKSRVRVIKSTSLELFEIYSGLKTYKAKKKREKLLIEKLKFTSYDTLNKRSVSHSTNEIEISVQDFIKNYCNEF